MIPEHTLQRWRQNWNFLFVMLFFVFMCKYVRAKFLRMFNISSIAVVVLQVGNIVSSLFKSVKTLDVGGTYRHTKSRFFYIHLNGAATVLPIFKNLRSIVKLPKRAGTSFAGFHNRFIGVSFDPMEKDR